MPVEPATQIILDQMATAGEVDFSDLAPDAFRELFRSMVGALDAGAAGEPEEDVEDRQVPGPAGPLSLRLYRPRGARAAAGSGTPLVTFFHGGGWVIGDIDTHDGSCRILSRRTGAIVVSVDYRLAPEHRFPAALDDCDAALMWVAAHAEELGGDPGRLGVAGDSAGGNLTAAVTQRAVRRGGPTVAAQALVYPATDLSTERRSFVDNAQGYFLTADAVRWFTAQYLGDHDRTDPGASPLLGDLDGLPRAVVATAEFDPLHDEGRAYADALEKAGVEVISLDFPGLIHGFMGLGMLSPGSAKATDDVWAAFAALLTA
jgi:acetyl esterase